MLEQRVLSPVKPNGQSPSTVFPFDVRGHETFFNSSASQNSPSGFDWTAMMTTYKRAVSNLTGIIKIYAMQDVVNLTF